MINTVHWTTVGTVGAIRVRKVEKHCNEGFASFDSSGIIQTQVCRVSGGLFDVTIILNCWVNFYRLIVYFSSFQVLLTSDDERVCKSTTVQNKQNSMIAIHRDKGAGIEVGFGTLVKGSTVQASSQIFGSGDLNDLKIFLLFTNYNMFKLLTSSLNSDKKWKQLKMHGLLEFASGCSLWQSQKLMGVWAKNALISIYLGKKYHCMNVFFKFLTWEIFYVISLKQ